MSISTRTVIFTIILGIILLAGCGAPASTEAPASVETGEPTSAELPAPAATEAPASESTSEPVGEEPTMLAPTEFPTSIPSQPAPQPVMPERRRLTLEFPPKIRAGDSDVVRLTLEVDDLGNVTPTAEIGENVVTGEVIEIPNLYESHHIIAEARFDIAGMEVRPPELISEPLAPGNAATFYWSIQAREVGVYRGTIWFYLRFVEKSSGEESRKTVSAQIVEIEAANLLGLSGNFARTTGVIGSLVGTIIGIPFFEDIIKLLFKRRNRLKK